VLLHYVRLGRGDPLLLLHGWPGFWYDWRRVLPPLAVVAWGELDPVIPAAWADRLGETFLDHELSLLPGIGHFVPFEAIRRALSLAQRGTQEGRRRNDSLGESLAMDPNPPADEEGTT
jgi:pimeloyl-ACP methyl ester carboxylesterase